MLTTEEKEEDEAPSHSGRTVQALAAIAASVEVALLQAAGDDGSIDYPGYDPKLDVKTEGDGADDDSLASFAG